MIRDVVILTVLLIGSYLLWKIFSFLFGILSFRCRCEKCPHAFAKINFGTPVDRSNKHGVSDEQRSEG